MALLRVPGWITDGTVKVPADTARAMSELVDAVRDHAAEVARLKPHETALAALLKGISAGMETDAFRDAYREALMVAQAK
jgi:hypothetical protein